MQPIVLMLLVAAIGFTVFLLLALVVRTIRTRRAEDGFEPAPEGTRKSTREISDPFSTTEPAPDWMRSLSRDSPEPVQSPGGESESPFKNLLRSAMPEISTLMDLGKMVKESQPVGEMPRSEEERNAAFAKAVDEMLEKQPDNAFLRQLRDSLPASGSRSDMPESENRIQVFQIGGKTTIRVDGVEYSSAEDIPDPEVREQVREKVQRLLDALNRNSWD
jgi:hypothetical protein